LPAAEFPEIENEYGCLAAELEPLHQRATTLAA